MQVSSFLSNVWPIALTCVLGLVAVFSLLPRPRLLPVLLGTACGVLALVLAGWLVTRASSFSIETFLFYVFAASAIGFGTLLVTQTNPARAALSFALVIISTCGLFLLQAAPFLMAATIIVYAGAIIVTFLFVIMLAQQEGPSDADARSREPLLSAFTGFLLLGTVLYVLKLNYKPDLDRWVRQTEDYLAEVKALAERTQSENPPKAAEVKTVVSRLESFRKDYESWWRGSDQKYPPGGKELEDALIDAQPRGIDKEEVVVPPDPEAGQTPAEVKERLRLQAEYLEEIVKGFHNLLEQGMKMRNNPLLGNRKPSPPGSRATAFSALSEMSGPRSNRPLDELRRDSWGRPRMPAQNAEYLGRSLFSDYLLAVELAGMLLLVATIGAIAIAQRRSASSTPDLTRERMS